MAFVQVDGQQPSLFLHAVISSLMQRALHACALPATRSSVHAFVSRHIASVGQSPSHVSGGVTTPSPQPLQSPSFAGVHDEGQQPSLSRLHSEMGVFVQRASHMLPATPSTVQASRSLQSAALLGQPLAARGSQRSGGVTTPSPQLALQSGSLPMVQPRGQQPSAVRRHSEIS